MFGTVVKNCANYVKKLVKLVKLFVVCPVPTARAQATGQRRWKKKLVKLFVVRPAPTALVRSFFINPIVASGNGLGSWATRETRNQPIRNTFPLSEVFKEDIYM